MAPAGPGCLTRMIERYTDHAANERTYLAWIRTAIAVMAFGFLIECFDLFLRLTTQDGLLHLRPSPAAAVGLGLFGAGALIIIPATVRFFAHRAAIESDEVFPYGVRKTNLLLSLLLLGIAVFLVVYVAHQVLS